jgi:hypothetical protein
VRELNKQNIEGGDLTLSVIKVMLITPPNEKKHEKLEAVLVAGAIMGGTKITARSTAEDGTIGGELESETLKKILQGRQISGNKLFHWKEQQAADEDCTDCDHQSRFDYEIVPTKRSLFKFVIFGITITSVRITSNWHLSGNKFNTRICKKGRM